MTAPFLEVLRRHEGTWAGQYRHLAVDGTLIDTHASRIECVFPNSGPYAYVQRNTFTWPDERVERYEFGGVLAGERLTWDTERFFGHAWATDHNTILLHLSRRDDPGVSFLEIIVLPQAGDRRMRTWHWFRGAEPIRRTLCDEHRIA